MLHCVRDPQSRLGPGSTVALGTHGVFSRVLRSPRGGGNREKCLGAQAGCCLSPGRGLSGVTPKHPGQGQHGRCAPGKLKGQRGKRGQLSAIDAGSSAVTAAGPDPKGQLPPPAGSASGDPGDQRGQAQALLSLRHSSISLFPSSCFPVTKNPSLSLEAPVPRCLSTSLTAIRKTNSAKCSQFPSSTLLSCRRRGSQPGTQALFHAK